MQPIVQKEFYLAKAAGLYDGEVPNPVTTTDYYYAALCGKYVGELPEPVTAEQKYLANLLGEDVAVPKPITLDDIFMYDAVMRIVAEEPVTRQQYYWRLIAKSRQYINKTASGNPITLTDSAENKPLNMKLYGWSKQDGEPSPDNPVEIESAGGDGKIGVSVRGKNLFDERLLDDKSNYDKQYQSLGFWILAIPVKNGLVTVSAKNTTNWGGYLCVNSTGDVGGADGAWMAHGSLTHLKRTVTLTSTNGFVYLLMSKGVDTNKRTLEEVGYIQVEYGTEATDYEPYRTTQSTSLITPTGLPAIPVPSGTSGITYTDANGQAWIADEIDLERRKYVQRVWKAVFDGSENWTLYTSVQYLGFAIRVLPQKTTRRYGFCTQYKTEELPTTNEAIWIGVGNDNLYVKNSRFYDELLVDKGLPNFKAHLAANPLVVMTYLDTPIERDLTSAELAEYTQLYSYKPTTVVENDSDCWMDVTALCKPK
jgi:hypothetical protein